MMKFSTLRATVRISSLAIACCSGLVWQAQAQVSGYTFSNNTITYSAISGTAMTAGTGWDDAVQNVALPFTFTFNCLPYTSVNISTNGFVAFGATAPSTVDYNPISGTTGYGGAASAFGRDLINNAVAVTYATVGTSPNREFVVQWTNARRYSLGAVAGDVLNFQIRLVETTNVVRLDYGTNTATSATALTCEVGLRGASNADFANRTATTTWTTTTAGGTNAATMTSSNTIMPSGRRYTYTPAACGPANDLVCNATPITCGATLAGTTVGATTTGTSEGTTTCGTTQAQPAVWYSVAGVTGTMTASLCGTAWDSKISVYSGATCGGTLTCIGGVDDNGPSCVGTSASFSWSGSSGTNYWIKVYGFSSNSAFNLNLTCLTAPACVATPTAPANGATGITAAGTTLSWPSAAGATGYDVYFGTTTPAPTLVSSNQAGLTYVTGALSGTTTYYWRIVPRNAVGPATGCANWSFVTAAGAPANDACANAIAIASLPYTSAVISNALATDDSPTSSCDGPYKNVWWTVTGICGTMTAITCTGGTNFDDEISVFTSTGGCSGPWTQVACNDDNGAGCTNNYAGTSWTATAGTTYYITVGSYFSSSATGNLQLNVTGVAATSSVAPTGVSGTTTIPSGGSTSLTATGGTLGAGAVVQWFTGSCGGTAAGTGNPISVSPTTTTTYFVRYSGTCNTTTCTSVTVTVTPANDACANAIAIASLPYTSAVIPNATATDDSPTSTCDGPYKNVWWTVTGICGTMTAITCTGGTNFDDEIAVFTSTGGCSGPWTQVACNDDAGAGCTGLFAGVSWTGTAGTTYYITVGSYFNAGPTGDLQLNVTATPFTASVAPTGVSGSTSICAGGSTTLSATGGTLGTGATIEWFTGSCGGTSAGTGSITVSPSITTTYFVRYSGTCNTTTCTSVTVTVNPLPTATASGGGTVCSSDPLPNVTFTFTGGAPYNFTYDPGAVPVTGHNSNTYTITNAAAGTYAVTALTDANCTGTNFGSSATVTVNPAATANASGPYTTCGTTAVNISATANGSGSWSGGLGSFANASNASTTYTPDPTEVGGSVTLTWTTNDPDGAGPCTSLGSNATLNVNTPATANAGGPYNTCGTTAVNISATANGSGSWSGGLGSFGNASNTSTTYTPDPTEVGGSVTLTWTTNDPDGAGPCTSVASNATLNVNICAWYSQSGGNMSDPIWSPFPIGTPGPATFTSTTAVFVQNGHTVTNTSANVVVDELTVDAGGTLVLNATTTLNTNGNVVVNGTLTANDNSTMLMSSGVAQTATFAATTSFWDLEVDATVSCTVTGNVEVRGSLNLLDGNFDCTGNQVSLTSSATQTGRLGPVSPTASYTGNMRIERFIPTGNADWRLLGSPIGNRTVNDWGADFITAGFPGSAFPNFDNPVGSNILWPSVRWYDETNIGAGNNDGMTGVSSIAQALSSGQGFAAFVGDDFSTVNAFDIDLRNGPPNIANTPISLPMSYTNTGNAAVDGWNLVSNPVPSAISFNQIDRGADVEDYITYYNPINGNTAVYDISLGFGTNGATNTVQSMQGFFLKAVGPAVATTVDEADKVNSNTGGIFGLGGGTLERLHLQLTSDINTFSDETVVLFSSGTPALDADDALKYVWANDLAPQIAALAPTGEQLAINAYGEAAEGFAIPLSVNVAISGEYTIGALVIGGLELSCLYIEDLLTGDLSSLEDGATYTFTMDAAADPAVVRFVLHSDQGPLAGFTADNTTVLVNQAVQFTPEQTAGQHAWDFGDGATSTDAQPSHAWIAAGTYNVVHTVSSGLCSNQSSEEVIVELSTGVSRIDGLERSAWLQGEHIIVQHGFAGSGSVRVELLDATGRKVMERSVGAATTRVLLPAADLANGVWFVRMVQGDEKATMRVPVLR